ncbi:MAG: hypothetical protein EAX89_00100 [Candidatus Lokiarchaeota archaeon]|nr:hypothetical protein [Candidatus Lokiarchaeota archaeon]
MSEEFNEVIKQELFKLISTPGIEIENIPEIINSKYNTNFSYERIYNFLSDEYLKHNLDHGRRLCCRF